MCQPEFRVAQQISAAEFDETRNLTSFKPNSCRNSIFSFGGLNSMQPPAPEMLPAYNYCDNHVNEEMTEYGQQQLEGLVAAVFSNELSLFADHSAKLTDVAQLRWLGNLDTTQLEFQYCGNTITLADSRYRAAVAECNTMVAITMVTSEKVEPFLPDQIAPGVNIKFSGEIVPELVLSHLLDIPITDQILMDYTLAVLKLAPSRKEWLVQQRIPQGDISLDGFRCYGSIQEAGTYTVALLPGDIDIDNASVPTWECAGGDSGEGPSESIATHLIPDISEPSTIPKLFKLISLLASLPPPPPTISQCCKSRNFRCFFIFGNFGTKSPYLN